MPPACLCDAVTPADEIYCCDALPAWNAGKYELAALQANRALVAQTDHSAAWLLFAFARYKQGKREEAITLLEGLASDPEVGGLARRALRNNNDRHNRDQVHLSAGAMTGAGPGPFFRLDVPLKGRLGLKMDVNLANSWLYELYGTMGQLGVSWNAVENIWRLQFHASLTVTNTREPSSLRGGTTAGMRLDTRITPGLGWGVEVGLGITDTPNWGVGAYPFATTFLTMFLPGKKHY